MKNFTGIIFFVSAHLKKPRQINVNLINQIDNNIDDPIDPIDPSDTPFIQRLAYEIREESISSEDPYTLSRSVIYR